VRRLLVLTATLIALVPPGGAAATSCAHGVVAGGRFLEPGPDSASLPPTVGTVAAFIPACNDQESDFPDEEVTAERLRGIPPHVAVLREGSLYVARESLRAVAGHPLPVRVRPSTRCRDRRTLHGEVSATRGNAIDLLVDRRPLRVLVDGRTRITNRPAHQPFNEDQALAITADVCNGTPVAREITFAGRTVPHDKWEPDFGGGISSLPPLTPVLVLGAILFTGVALWLSLRRP
jgi:hypothetical protein